MAEQATAMHTKIFSKQLCFICDIVLKFHYNYMVSVPNVVFDFVLHLIRICIVIDMIEYCIIEEKLYRELLSRKILCSDC